MNIDLDQLRALMEAMREFELDEMELENSEERIVLRRGGTAPVAVAAAAPAYVTHAPSMVPPAPAAASVPPPAPADAADVVYVTSPFVGTFYRSSSPGAEPFAKVGSRIEVGQTLCIVEAMKLMNEIESELAGEILEVLVENGKTVEYGDKLFKVRKAG
ncbi:MAG: acetyl-CoA carboxylase biotin carboxyl carrier protein [Sandaracinus sp.]|nr:acetyl-CoA carboxylase biotin carboxyl carrier protein [Sandaracinus sp.]MCB9634906.1 acetyl-CoA carboxylase biotin carboxyl carrier protein [Sandaracinus sp.]